MIDALRHHWPEYLIEAALLGAFMISACGFGALLYHPSSPFASLGDSLGRRAAMGAAMGFTAVALIYSPWGKRSGAHMNPAVTLTFLRLGNVAPWDAAFYVMAHCAGAFGGVLAMRAALGDVLAHSSVNYVATVPGVWGAGAAFAAECAISFVMMATILFVSNHTRLEPFTGLCAGALVMLFITFESPVSGMSINPARTLGSALVAQTWTAFWVYVAAPVAGMFLAMHAYARFIGRARVRCAKLHHRNSARCIFCEYQRARATTRAAHIPSVRAGALAKPAAPPAP